MRLPASQPKASVSVHEMICENVPSELGAATDCPQISKDFASLRQRHVDALRVGEIAGII